MGKVLNTALAGLTALAMGAPAAQATSGPEVTSPVQVRLGSRVTAARHSGFQVDPHGTRVDETMAFSSRLRLRLSADSGDSLGMVRLMGQIGGEAMSGTWTPAPSLEGDELPGASREHILPMEAWAQLSVGPWVGLRAGLMLSHWGLGLIANAGDDLFDGTYRTEGFRLARPGDRMLRAMLYLRPFASMSGSPASGLVLAGAFDRVVEDDTSSWADGDTTYHAVGSVKLHLGDARWVGVYYVYRDQRAEDDDFLRAHVVDLAGDFRFDLDPQNQLRLQFELAGIFGRTSYGSNPTFPEHDVLQLGGLARLGWSHGELPLRAELDLGYFSGDGNMDDDRLTRFVSDRNFRQGILLFPTLTAWYTGRHRVTASDPNISGYPPEDLDRLSTDGGVTSAITLFPRLYYAPLDSLDIYLGAVVAFASETVMDPFTSRTVGGGEPYNSLGAKPDGSLLGTELDLGIRYALDLPDLGASAIFTAEYGVFLPGGAMRNADGETELVHGGHFSIALTGRFVAASADEGDAQ